MRIIILILLIIFFNNQNSKGQRIVEKSVNYSSQKQLNLHFKFADNIIISSWDEDKIRVKAIVDINNGEHNDKFELKQKIEDNEIFFESIINDLKKIHKKSKRTITDEDGNKNVTINCETSMDIQFEVKLPRNINLNVRTINGDIEIDGVVSKIKAKSISGFVDLAWPEKKGAKIYLSSISGDLFSDFDFDMSQTKKRHHVKIKYSTTYKDGGNPINLKSISGNVYFRKEK